MILEKVNLVPDSIRAQCGGPNTVRLGEWRDQLNRRMRGAERPPEPQRPLKCFNWTDTRGDRFAVCFAPDIYQAQRFVVRHAFVHLCEIDAAERGLAGHSIPTNKTSLEKYYRRLNNRACNFAMGCKLRELTREEYIALCREQQEIR